MMAGVLKVTRLLLPAAGAAAGGLAYTLAGGAAGGTAFVLILHCGMLVGWVAQRTLQSLALAAGHLPPGDWAPSDQVADALIDAELARLASEAAAGPGPARGAGGGLEVNR